MSQESVLIELEKSKEWMTVRQLVDKLKITNGNVSRACMKLAQQGYVHKKAIGRTHNMFKIKQEYGHKVQDN